MLRYLNFFFSYLSIFCLLDFFFRFYQVSLNGWITDKIILQPNRLNKHSFGKITVYQYTLWNSQDLDFSLAHIFALLCFAQSVFQLGNRGLFFSVQAASLTFEVWGRVWKSPSKLFIPGLLKVAFILVQVRLSCKWSQRRVSLVYCFHSKEKLCCINYLFVYHLRSFS